MDDPKESEAFSKQVLHVSGWLTGRWWTVVGVFLWEEKVRLIFTNLHLDGRVGCHQALLSECYWGPLKSLYFLQWRWWKLSESIFFIHKILGKMTSQIKTCIKIEWKRKNSRHWHCHGWSRFLLWIMLWAYCSLWRVAMDSVERKNSYQPLSRRERTCEMPSTVELNLNKIFKWFGKSFAVIMMC